MNILDDLTRAIIESKMGRIHKTPANWTFNPGQAKNYNRDRPDADGVQMSLVKQLGVHCRNPDVAQGRYPKTKGTKDHFWWVPLKHCRKCEHYCKAPQRGSHRYPYCNWRRQHNGGARAAAAAEICSLIRKSVKETNKILKG